MSDYYELIEVVWDAIEETTRAAVDRSRVETRLGSIGIIGERTAILRMIIACRIQFPPHRSADELHIGPDTPVTALTSDIAGIGGTLPR
jgi:hypothetical protein